MRILYFLLFVLIVSCTKTKESNVNKSEKVDNPYYEKAWSYLDKKDPINAFLNFNKAKEIYLKNNDSLGVGKCLMNMGIILTDQGDYFGAQETSLEAMKYLKEDIKADYNYINANYNNLGIASYNLKDYMKALKFYDLAIKFSSDSKDIITYSNNEANTYREQKKYPEALKVYNQILKENNNKKSTEYSRALTNLAKTKWLQNANYNPVSELKEALNIRLQEQDLWGQNSSYAHLADYYIQKKPDSALIYATKMYGVAKKLKSPDDQIEALQKLIILENPEKSKQYFLTYQKLNDSLQTARSKAKNQFALIRYETEKNKADFQKAQADNVKKQNQILKQYAGLGILGLVLIGGGVWYRRRKKILQQEKELEVKKTELRYSKKVHDVVANGIHRVMTKLENQEHIDKETMLDDLEIVYEKSRDISYDHEKNNDLSYGEKLTEMLKSYSSDDLQLVIIGNEEMQWDKLNKNTQAEVFYVLQELMTNMKKHSKATRVVIRMSRINEEITIRYTDNGVGCDKLSPKNGIKNTGNRMESIGGTINFDAVSGEGFKAELKFSVQ
ncbi:tetratricopeptide repeat-containing sensor histidine kinase [Elizabethkingia anophelis]|uniref:histidine kinase n=1 Tax=Elizabethkingia anophelis NUHP1 TaxID=1338011 RepID=A0A077EAQ6_9FLAO|nr:tetratricopeptide repeat protein [Elizabethkingia anophelis]AIL44686.1 Sensory box histidine kinase [Elizabethkingia anophelis NUHP1]MBE9395069.1 tetratricopeptide repeat protein [Elizabethkingia anophelis]MBE9408964.1 tetratricopeptide repeat protein [Elizabethkingia anophelis]MCT3778231.1 tetratricopeptide repeat protein [Elizabethkingia anophelis]MCT3785345.1 tetratricopeptide repeat protein [Elizabethkingia anophelis]